MLEQPVASSKVAGRASNRKSAGGAQKWNNLECGKRRVQPRYTARGSRDRRQAETMRQTASGRAPGSRSSGLQGIEQVPIVGVVNIEAFITREHFGPISDRADHLHVASPRARIISVSDEGPARCSIFYNYPVNEI